MSDLSTSVRNIRTELLQSHLEGRLKGQKMVLEIVRKHQPPSGLDNQSWVSICDFILEIEFANKIPAAKIIADKYNLKLTF